MVLPPEEKIRSRPVDRVKVTEAGFEGDRHAGLTRQAGSRDSDIPRGTVLRNERQVSMVAQEDLDQIAAKLNVAMVNPEWLGANIAFEGVEQLSNLKHGTRLRFEGGVVLVVESENKPCRTPGEVIAQEYPEDPGLAARFTKQALGLRGLVGWVDTPGVLTAGEQVTIDTSAASEA